MTFEDKLKELLVGNGLFDNQADEVVIIVKNAPENDIMAQRWNDRVEDYPPMMVNILWFTAKRHALEYIDANCPQAWFRPMFVDKDPLRERVRTLRDAFAEGGDHATTA